jgi:hypothetical protein
VSDVVQTVGPIGSSGTLQDIVNTSSLIDGLNVNNLDDVLAGSVGGHGLDGALGKTSGITPVISNLGDSASNLVNPVVSGAGQAVDTLTSGGSAGDILNGVGQDAGTLADAAGSDLNSVTHTGIVGNVLNGVVGDNIATGAVGDSGLLAGTPLDGLQGDGALASTNLLRGDDSSSSSLVQVGAGTDQSQGLVNVNAASNPSGGDSHDLVDTNTGPSSSGNGANANLLGASQDSGSLINADAGRTEGTTPVTVNAATNADQFQFPALAGTGTDSLVGETGQLPGNPVSVDTGADLLPLGVQADSHDVADISGPDALGAGDHANDGTHIAVTTPLQGALV